MKLLELKNLFEEKLKNDYSKNEIDIIFFEVAQSILKKSKSELRLSLSEEFKNVEDLFQEKLMLLNSGKPLQYVLGNAEFYGLDFFVNENVLIPRPETEELVEWILEETDADKKFSAIDIGTGSGAIAVALKKHLPNAEIYALDFSEKALEVARINADYHKTKIEFIQTDFLNIDFNSLPEADIIISNPPYIREKEKAEMHETVLKYEPNSALFVPDENPLIFYKKIAEYGKLKLKHEGKIYVEINQNLGEETKKLFSEKYKFTKLKKDISGNERMLKTWDN